MERSLDNPNMSNKRAALPKVLMEQELFGYVNGSLTGTVTSTKGYFEDADGGTRLLEERGKIAQGLQLPSLGK